MSTVSKLDINTRRSRKDRKAQLQALARDVVTFTRAGRHNEAGLCSAVLQHLTKICKDPKRTGATKDAILAKLGGY